MKIVTYKPKVFEGHKIFVRRIGTYFESIFIINDEVYPNHSVIRPTVFATILYWLGIRDDVYDREQIIYIQKYLETLAMGSIRAMNQEKINKK